MNYISEKHPELYPLHDEIYNHGSRLYWEALDKTIRNYAAANELK